jgi:hypothetical protein
MGFIVTYLDYLAKKTKGTTTFLPTVEPSSHNFLLDSPPSLTMRP